MCEHELCGKWARRTVDCDDGCNAERALHVLDRQIVDEAAVNEHVSVRWIADWWQISEQRHAGTHVAPQRALRSNESDDEQINANMLVYAHGHARHVGADAVERQPQVLDRDIAERLVNDAESKC